MSRKLLNLCFAALLSVVSTAAWALSEVGGVYQIGTAEDLIAFAELVNGENPSANAVLTADIVKPVDDNTMIGRNGQDYQGIFDGQGHTITIDLYDQDSEGTALFRNVGVHALIQNLKVQGTIHSDQKLSAGIAAWNSGRIRGCYIDVNVVSAMAGDATHGGIAAVAYRGTVIENCLAKFTINGATTQNCGGIVGWASDKINIANCLVISDGSSFDLSNNGSNNIARNDGNINVVNLENYNANPYANRPAGASYNNYVTNQWGNNKATTVVAYEDLADGRICYQLNNDQSKINWVQTIGTDPFPVPAAFGSGRVYASETTDCDGKTMTSEVTYTNSGEPQATAHQFDKYGICTVCGCFNTDGLEFDEASNAVLLKSASDIDLVEGWNRIGDGFKLNMKMANDIEYIAAPGHAIVNTSNWVDGNFDGQGHELTIQVSDVGTDAACFIPQHTGIFENVIMHGTISTTGQYAGSISARARQATVRNVFSDIEINTTHVDDNTSGGLFGIAYGTKNVDNCVYAGNINGIEGTTCIAGFCGWADGTTYFNNCAFLGTLNNAGGDSRTISRNLGKAITNNVYSTQDYGTDYDGERNLGDADKYIYENQAGVESGELAYFLNGKAQGVDRFYQKIGEDLFPMPIKKEGALVYATAQSYRCDGQPMGTTSYGNTYAGDPILPDHQYEDGFCTVCEQLQEDFLTPVDGWFEISNGAELLWWSHYASKHLNASAKLTDDIDMNGYSDRWADIGTRGAPFYGSFDGQYHTISNLNIYRPGTDGAGLIGIMNSQPTSGFGGLSDTDARNAEGVFIKNVVLDETCSIYAHGYAAIVGMTANWAGHITFEGLMMLGDVTVDGGVNGGGILGCVMNEACRVTINNCGMIGNIHSPNASHTENGSFSGWIGKWAELTNCFAIGEVENVDADRGFARHYVGNADHKIVIKNCYALDGIGLKQTSSDSNDIEDVTFVSADDLATGAITWKANGSQFRTPVWYQTLGDDDYPYPFPTHGVVIFGAEQYFSVADEEELEDVATEIQNYEGSTFGDDPIATKAVLDFWNDALEGLTDAANILDFADALEAVYAAKDSVATNVAVYQAYIAKCNEVRDYLEANPDLEGDLLAALVYYLNEDDEASAENPLGTYSYIIENHTATAEEIKEETERVDLWLASIIAGGYVPGTDVSNLIPNYDFSKQKESWTNGWCTGYGKAQTESGKTVNGVEAWNVTGDMYQTVEGMQPGYYLVGINGAFRPSNNRYSYNYAAGIYANGIFNYFPTVIEDYVAAADTIDGVNCNLHVKSAYDLAIYDDYESTSAEQAESNAAVLLGYAVHGETGMAIAAMVNRYQAYTIAYVGEDGKLTIGIKNPGTKYSNDWTGWGALKVIYCGDDEDKSNEALDQVLENMSARAQVLVDSEYSEDNAPLAPNFPEALREALQEAIDAIGSSKTIEDKAELAARFSELFQEVYEGKQAYIALFKTWKGIESIGNGNLYLVEKDENGEWTLDPDGEELFSVNETDALFDISAALESIYLDGSYSTEEALALPVMAEYPDASEIIPEQDENGYFLISNPKHVAAFRAICNFYDRTAKAKMVADVDMTGIAMEPIGHKDNIFGGAFDGQGHSLTNVYINTDYMTITTNSDPATLFYELKKATVKNLKLTGEYHSNQKFMGGITRWMSEGSTIDNCDIAVVMHSAIEGDGTHGGVVGVTSSDDEVISNCLIHNTFLSDEGVTTTCVGGVCGWTGDSNPQVKNTLILSNYDGVSDDGSNTLARNGCSATNVYVSQTFGGSGGTVVTSEQLASGEITYRLNENKSDNPYWFQTIGTDTIPRLFEGGVVYYYGGQYMNEKPNPQLNAFAYNLDAKVVGDNVVVSFDLNAEAEGAEVRFYNGEELIYTETVSEELAAGTNSVRVAASNLGSDPTTLDYEVAVTGKGSLQILKVGESYKFNSPYGLAINNNPASKGFGQVLVTETRPTEDPANMFSTGTPGALFAFDAAFEPVGSYYGGLEIAGEEPLPLFGEYELDLKDLRFSKDGRLFVARAAGLSNSSVYEINPDDLNEAWSPVFTGGELDEATGITYVGSIEQNRPAVGLALENEGEDLKMYVLGVQGGVQEATPTAFNCAVYDLGVSKTYSFEAPSRYIEALDGAYAAIPTHIGISEDGQGGLWFIQDADTHSAEIPSIKHFDAEGNEDYSEVALDTHGGKIAITTDGMYLAIPQGSGKVVIYETNYVPMGNGKIFLDPKYNVSVTESQITGLAFDYANNLYVASSNSKTLSRYVIPSWNENLAVTPGNGIGTGVQGDVNNDGKVDVADAQTILNFIADEDYMASADINGDGKVDVADYQSILNIIADE